METLKFGSRGDSVKQLQTKLGITADGIFGNQTANALKAYQSSKGLVADAIAGAKTWASLLGTPPQTGVSAVPYAPNTAPTPLAPKPVLPTPTGLPITPVTKPVTPTAPTAPIASPTAPTTGGTYTIKAGDTLTAISRNTGVPLNTLLQYNPQISNPNLIRAGASLNLSQPTTPVAPVETPDLGQVKTTTKDATTGATTTITEPVAPEAPTTPPSTPEEATTSPISKYIKDTFGYDDEGIKKLFESFQMQPEKSFEELSQDIYGKLGLDKVKTQIDDLTSKISTIDNQSSDAISQINENPWLSEKSRSFRVQNIEERANKQKQTLINELNLATNQYNRGREEAMNAAQMTLEQFNTQKKYDTERLQFMFDRAEQAASLMKKDTAIPDKILSPTEAATLGVPYGTTQSQASSMGITPSRYKPTVSETDRLVGTQSKAEVKAIQTQLNAQGANLVVDGILGPKTKAAMAKYGMDISTEVKAPDKFFTQSQINKGASVLGTTADKFNELSYEARNVLVNQEKKVSTMLDVIGTISTGKSKLNNVIADIQTGNLPLDLKIILIKKAQDNTPEIEQTKWWDNAKKWFIKITSKK